MSLLEHAKNELTLIGGEDDEMQQAMNKHILTMVEIFANEGHSGFSASYAIGVLTKLLKFEPLTPLTGDESEWTELSEYSTGEKLWQNKRCSRVFKNAEGAYDIEGRIFRDPSGYCFTNRESRVFITFPYIPKHQYVDVENS